MNLGGMGLAMSTKPINEAELHAAPHAVVHDERLVGEWRLQLLTTARGDHAAVRLLSQEHEHDLICLHSHEGHAMQPGEWGIRILDLGALLKQAILAIEN